MSIFNRFRSEPPPPPPIYKRQPIATAAVILTLVGMFVLGPVGYLWNGMAEELKAVKAEVKELEKDKATNENVKEALNELKEQRKETQGSIKEQNNAIQKNQVAIERILIRQELLPPGGFKLKGKSDGPPAESTKEKVNRIVKQEKPVLTPEQFERYMEMKPEIQAKYKKYLESRGYDINGL